MQLVQNPAVAKVFENYPEHVRSKMLRLRQLVIDTASEIEGIDKLEETLKWGEPSYLTKKGSTLRMDWKQKTPDQYALYFSCSTSLVETFKVVYGPEFKYEGNRAIVFDLNDNIPTEQLKQCITMALTYHKVKHLPLLGA